LSTNNFRRGRRLVPAVIALGLMATVYSVAQKPEASAEERDAVASRYGFEELPIKLPPGLPEKGIREVNPAYKHIEAWVSSVGGAIAINDLDGTGKAADLCIVDPRSDEVIITPVPGTGERYEPFTLEPAPLPMDKTMAPTGCVPNDFNEDGRLDLFVYFVSRTPILYLSNPNVSRLAPAAYTPTEVIPTAASPSGAYTGPRWQTYATTVDDFDGDGHADVIVPNYFPDSDAYDPNGQNNVQMNDSMSRALNGGGAHVLRWTGVTDGKVAFEEQRDAIPYQYATGWTLGAGGADLDGDLLPELYIANDFGQDRLFHNISKPGKIGFALAEGSRTPTTPKSMVIGHDSFKGMSIDFGDLRNTGRFDAFVSNITVAWGVEESNLLWLNTAKDNADAKRQLSDGEAPFVNDAGDKGVAWTGWGWDAKLADFDNSGNLAIVQADGFVKGTINRWNWLQELAMMNDQLVHDPKMWPKAEAGDDIAGDEFPAFYAPSTDGSTYVNIAAELGLDARLPTRGIAVGDSSGAGRQDLAIARQWAPPAFYRNNLPSKNDFVGLRLYRPVDGTDKGGNQLPGTPAYGAMVKFTTADGKVHLSRVDGGSGHAGKRSFDIFFGLGNSHEPVKAEICWRDRDGQVHMETKTITPGWHDLLLDGTAQEVTQK
jgi:hypothetical protein